MTVAVWIVSVSRCSATGVGEAVLRRVPLMRSRSCQDASPDEPALAWPRLNGKPPGVGPGVETGAYNRPLPVFVEVPSRGGALRLRHRGFPNRSGLVGAGTMAGTPVASEATGQLQQTH